ncbi:MAG: hypothetical protein AAB932_05405, partial [Patescibacteria group bacterium]
LKKRIRSSGLRISKPDLADNRKISSIVRICRHRSGIGPIGELKQSEGSEGGFDFVISTDDDHDAASGRRSGEIF